MKKESIKKILFGLWFEFIDWENNILLKAYNDLEIKIDLSSENWRIDFWNKIKINRETTSNFSQEETCVVLECVDRLLTKWYNPENIELEKSWKLWHKWKWFLDIFVTDKDQHAFLMIECKTWSEYDKELSNMFNVNSKWEPKWQLFSYFSKERWTQYLCLYTSKFTEESVEYRNSIIYMDKDIYSNCENDKEVFNSWNKQFSNNGIFENDIKPYCVNIRGILEDDLIDLDNHSWWQIFNQFAEILRRNVVSDKTNAFNKIFNLFICKVVDEDKLHWNPSEEMKFQWKLDETPEEVLKRLSDLYKEWINDYLQLDVVDYSDDEISEIISSSDWSSQSKTDLKRIINDLRLYKNSEFAFKEVFNQKTFHDNAKVVKEVVKLLEKYRIRYSHKHQFLWDFFEKLLNTWIKQEAGQFFTPVPIAKFINYCIPYEDIITQNIKEWRNDFLPYVIDYSSWAWHFLTEAMDRIDVALKEYNEEDFIWWTMKRNFRSYIDSYWFAQEYIYGIEKDYRLAKTSKVSCFLNGDWDANIITSDGLNNFNCDEYQMYPKLGLGVFNQENPVFDCLIANPPYSVKSFKNNIPNLKKSFSLYSKLTDQSNEIECLFIERMYQLLKEWGHAGIILPISILKKKWIHEVARGFLLERFNIKAIVELWNRAFMATDTKTVILFLEKKKKLVSRKAREITNNFLIDYKDVSYNGIESIFLKYVSSIYDISVDEYRYNIEKWLLLDDEYKDAFLESKEYKKYIRSKVFKNNTDSNHEVEFKRMLSEFIIEKERKKIYFYLLATNQNVLCLTIPEKQEGKDFLWYEFSDKKWQEWIKYYHTEENNKSTFNTSLYNESNILDETKVNFYILQSFKWNKINNIDENLNQHLSVKELNRLFNYDEVEFDKSINTKVKKVFEIKSKFPLAKLWKEVNFFRWSSNYTNAYLRQHKWKYPIYSSSTQKEWLFWNIDDFDFDEECLTITTNGVNAGTLFHRKKHKFSLNADCAMLNVKDEKTLNLKYLFYVLGTFAHDLFDWETKVSISRFNKIKIPLPPKEGIQDKIVREIEEIEEHWIPSFKWSIKELEKEIDKRKKDILEKYL